MIDTGEIIRNCRHFRGMTQTELAARSGVRKQTISHIEQTSGCNTRTLFRLLNAMGFDWDIIVMEDWKK